MCHRQIKLFKYGEFINVFGSNTMIAPCSIVFLTKKITTFPRLHYKYSLLIYDGRIKHTTNTTIVSSHLLCSFQGLCVNTHPKINCSR